ncbi:MAG: DUF4263 domain-containing protein [Oligoflexia bacterium]|nr:DUF4263 domain-containing protein [Oligoflexia bacterium]
MAKKKKKAPKVKKDHVVVSSKSYGKALKGAKIYFEGKRPSNLKDDGTIGFGKHILETLKKKYEKFRWIITQETNSITNERGIVRVRTSQQLLKRMTAENWDRSRAIKNDIVQRFFSLTFPAHFDSTGTTTYVPGTISKLIDPGILPRLSSQDKEALNTFLPKYVSAEAVGMVQKLQATAQIDSLKALAKNLSTEIEKGHPESWWQTYIKTNILLIQQGYIDALDKLNVAVGDTKFPDFCLITHDNYLDVLEIKKPDTGLLREDSSRGNFYWDTEVSKAISQTENYVQHIQSKADAVRSYLQDERKISIKAVRPRGIILVGDARQFETQKQKDDFRLLSQGMKGITILTYDELLTRLENYIHVLEKFSLAKPEVHQSEARKTK